MVSGRGAGGREPRGAGAQEELRAVGARAGVGHREDARAGVLELKVLILELGAVDGLAAGAVAGGEVAALAHELGDHAVERRALVAEALLAGAQGTEVLQRKRRWQVEINGARGKAARGREGA